MKKLIIYIIVTLSLGLIPAWLQYGGFNLVGDFLTQQIPFIIETKRMLSSGAPFWSWNTYFGDNFLADYSFYTLTSPFVWINCLFPIEYLYQSITLTLFLKVIVLGILSRYYLLKIGISSINSNIGALLFVFCSYNITNIFYYHFFEPEISFVFLLIAIEKYISKEKYAAVLLFFASFFVLFTNFYFAPCSLITATIYFFIRQLEKKKDYGFKYFYLAIPIVCLGLLAASFVIIPTIVHLQGGERMGVSFLSGYNPTERIYALLFPKFCDGKVPLIDSSPHTSTAGFIPIFGILPVILYGLKKKDSYLYTTIILILLYITPFNGIFSIFTNPDYARWVYTLSFFIIIITVKFLNDNEIFYKKKVYCYICICALFLFIRYLIPITKRIINKETLIRIDYTYLLFVFILFFLSCHLLLFCCKHRKYIIISIISLSVVSLAISFFFRSDLFYNRIDKQYEKMGIYDIYIKNNTFPYQTKSNNYRTDFLSRPYSICYQNMGLLKNCPSVDSFHSIKNKNILSLYKTTENRLDVPKIKTNKDCNTTSFDCLMSVKEIIKYNDTFSNIKLTVPCDLVEENKSYNRYLTKYYIPFGFTYDTFIYQEDIDKEIDSLPRKDIPSYMLQSIAIKEKDSQLLGKYLQKADITEVTNLDSIVDKRNQVTAYDMNWTTKGFDCYINMDRNNVVFFSVPSDSGFEAKVDGKKTHIFSVNCGLSGIIVPYGIHSIEFSYFTPGLIAGIIISFFSILLFLVYNYFIFSKLYN